MQITLSNWKKRSLKRGDYVTIGGWPGNHFVRVHKIQKTDKVYITIKLGGIEFIYSEWQRFAGGTGRFLRNRLHLIHKRLTPRQLRGIKKKYPLGGWEGYHDGVKIVA